MSENEAQNQHKEQADTQEQATVGVQSSLHGHPPVAPPLEELFDRNELAQFDADDVAAGRILGKMLAIFFLYTVVAMSIVAWWTFKSLGE